MKILAFETSCDETGIALVEGTTIDGGVGLPAGGQEFKTLRAELLSQAALHAEYGGVYPNLAKREHEKNLPILYRKFADEPCDAVAVTEGPGLEPALWQGIEFAKRVARDRGVPLLAVNHMEGHLISSLAQNQHPNKLEYVRMSLQGVKLPVLALLISGGHTEFIVMKEWFEYQKIGETLDDAVGECFDKVARMLGLPYPGGPEISKLAVQARKGRQTILSPTFSLPRPMLHSNTCDTSFSGLKTAALYAIREITKVKPLSDDEKAAFAAEFEDAVAEVFVAKTRRALLDSGAQTFVVGGGVAANRYIRERLQQLLLDDFADVELRLPDPTITGDNAIMIAQAALARALFGKDDTADDTLRAVGNLVLAGYYRPHA